MRPENKNLKLLLSFFTFCANHPELRFWQALQAWSGYCQVLVIEEPEGEEIDTYYFEGKSQ